MLEVEVVKLLLTVHLDDQGNNQYKERSSGDPRGLSSALKKFLGNDGGVGRGLLAPTHDRRLRYPCEDAQGSSTARFFSVPSLREGRTTSSGLRCHDQSSCEERTEGSSSRRS